MTSKLRIDDIWYLSHIYISIFAKYLLFISLLACWSFVLMSKGFYKLRKLALCLWYVLHFAIFHCLVWVFFHAEYFSFYVVKFIQLSFVSLWIMCHYEEGLSHCEIKKVFFSVFSLLFWLFYLNMMSLIVS